MLKIVPRDASDDVPAQAIASRGACSASRLFAVGALLSLLAVAALWTDVSLARYFAQHDLPGELRRLVRLSEVFAWGGTVALIIGVAATLDARGWRIVPRLAVCAFGAGMIADGIKLFVSRQRPSAGNVDSVAATIALPAAHASGHAVQSFPSGHAATAVGLAIALAALYPRGRWLFWTFAALAMFQRVESRAHFGSDVLAGAAIGCFVGAVWEWRAGGCCGERIELR